MKTSNPKIILASSSPRRQQILSELGLSFSIIKPDIDEHIDYYSPGAAARLAKDKAKKVSDEVNEECIIIASDTIVTDGKNILGKPKDKKDAERMLTLLSGRSHFVVSGICLIDKRNDECYFDEETTIVIFRKLSKKQIISYINTFEPFDKAGAYGIQGFGRLIVEKIDGCFFNVMGLPVGILNTFLKKAGIDILEIAGGVNGSK